MAKALDKKQSEKTKSARMDERIEQSIEKGRDALVALQQGDGYWCFEVEADCTIPAETILMMHYMDEIDEHLEGKIANYLREKQGEDGGWNLFYGGDTDMSATVKSYYALKLAGDSPDAEHMRRAREAVLARGGAARANVFTHYVLAQFEQIPWSAVPFLPVEVILLPRWAPVEIYKLSYWARTVMIPLSILYTYKATAKNPRGVDVQELFVRPPDEETDWFPVRSRLNKAFLAMERTARHLEPFIPKPLRKYATRKAERWFVERLNGEGGLGAIFPAMVNSLEALATLGYPPDHPLRRAVQNALDLLKVEDEDKAYYQPCVSPVWDTAWAAVALLEAAGGSPDEPVYRALDWLRERQVCVDIGDWRVKRPHLSAGGFAFQFQNPYYPDLDDTAMVARIMHRADRERYRESINRAVEWLCGMQSANGGFAAFDVDNNREYLNEIPFADHGALLDPPTADVSARCAKLLAILARPAHQPVLEKCLEYLRSEQEADGSWFGRWGTNYIYGTWSAIEAFAEACEERDLPVLQRAAMYLEQMQREDGGWGESCYSYYPGRRGENCPSTSFQTAWALLGLMAAGRVDSPEVERGVEFLLRSQASDGLWHDNEYTAPGFPRVFYLKYHGYARYFPLWALSRYRNLRRKESS
ncbi:MAG: squalene--hopene cyclase [Desulfatibacillaceae bacterium]